MYDRETHDRLARAAFDWCEDVAKRFDAPAPNGKPVAARVTAPPTPIDLLAEYDAVYSPDVLAVDGNRAFVATIGFDAPLYANAKISALVLPLQKRYVFGVPASPGESFKITLHLPVTADRVTLTTVRIISGPAPSDGETTAGAPATASAVAIAPAASTAAASSGMTTAAEALSTAAATPVASAGEEMAEASSAAAAPMGAPAEAAVEAAVEAVVEAAAEAAPVEPPALMLVPAFAMPAPPPRAAKAPKPTPIPIAGNFQAVLAPSRKTAMGKVSVTIAMPWVEPPMYPGAKLSVYIPTLAKTMGCALPAKSGDLVQVPLTMSDTVGEAPFAVGPISIVSGPAPQAAAPIAPPPPIAMPLQSVVHSSLAAATAATQAASVALHAPPHAAVVAQAVAPKPPRGRAQPRAKPLTVKPATKRPRPPSTSAQKKKPRRVAPVAPAPVVAPVAPPVASRSGRSVRAATRFGDSGEMDGAARSFQSTPLPTKAIVPLAVEVGAPGFALPGNFVWASGLHGGVRKLLAFKASIVKIRTRYPRIHVRYEADRAGSTARINLPEVLESYIQADQVAEYDGA